jgi:hypothetical protein
MIPNQFSDLRKGKYYCKKWQGECQKKNGLFIFNTKTIPIDDLVKI